jgi:hypothetical protein
VIHSDEESLMPIPLVVVWKDFDDASVEADHFSVSAGSCEFDECFLGFSEVLLPDPKTADNSASDERSAGADDPASFALPVSAWALVSRHSLISGEGGILSIQNASRPLDRIPTGGMHGVDCSSNVLKRSFVSVACDRTWGLGGFWSDLDDLWLDGESTYIAWCRKGLTFAELSDESFLVN